MDKNIVEGAVFHFDFDEMGIENHYHIIANIDAATGSALLFGVITSHVDMRKQDAEDTDESPDTIVDISPTQCSCLRCESVIDCNVPLVLKKIDLKKGLSKGIITFKCYVSKDITSKIRKGIRISKNADNDAKGLTY